MYLNSLQIKRCGEMSRKLRFMKDQMAKAGIVHSEMPTQIRIDFDELEVTLLFKCYLYVGICL